jgi:hypothetical protein
MPSKRVRMMASVSGVASAADGRAAHVAMAMGDHGARDRHRRIDVKVSGLQ